MRKLTFVLTLGLSGCAVEAADPGGDEPLDETTSEARVSSKWLTMAPRQCGMNPWEKAVGSEDELTEVFSYLASRNISVESAGFLHSPTPVFVCMACQCPRGDTLLVKAKTSRDATKLKRMGFVAAPSSALYTHRTVQCGGNPWEALAGEERESVKLGQWAEANGADVSRAGFLRRSEPVFVCAACQCPRGDAAVVIAAPTHNKDEFLSLNFAPVN